MNNENPDPMSLSQQLYAISIQHYNNIHKVEWLDIWNHFPFKYDVEYDLVYIGRRMMIWRVQTDGYCDSDLQDYFTKANELLDTLEPNERKISIEVEEVYSSNKATWDTGDYEFIDVIVRFE